MERTLGKRVACAALALMLAGSLALAGCSSDSTTSSSSSPPAPPGGQTGAPPGGGGTQQYTPTGAYTVDGETASASADNYDSAEDDVSAILVTGSGSLDLTDVTVTSSGSSSSSDESSFYGLNAGILVNDSGALTMTGGTVSTTGDGANGIFVYGEGASATLSGVTVKATGQYAHGIMTSGGGTITATDVNASSTGANSGVVATDRGGGTITIDGGSYTTSGKDSPAIYSTGDISATEASFAATGSESVVVEGANSVTLTDCTVTSSLADKWGVMIYQSMSGDAEGTEGTFTMTGGLLSNTAATGPLFHVTNSTAVITLSGVDVSVGSGTLVDASADKWGTSGSNGGTAMLTATGQTLEGDMVADDLSVLEIVLKSGSKLTGAIDAENTAKSAALTLDSSSTWTVTADSHLNSLTGAVISGSSITNIIGNGHTVTYDASACTELGGKTYTLAGGGTLQPE